MVEFNFGRVTLVVIISCIAVFIIQSFIPELVTYWSFSLPNFLINPLVLITASLIHASIAHLIYNCIALFILGNALEVKIKSKGVLLLLFFSVSGSFLVFALFFPLFNAVGISGFVYGIIGSLVIVNPKMKILMPLGMLSLPVPIIIAGPLIAFGELILSFAINSSIAHIAHFAGFIIGLLHGIKYLRSNQISSLK